MKFSSDLDHYENKRAWEGLDWRDLFRIGSLWVDIKIDKQSWLPDLGFIQYEQKA